ncbi:MAG: efflux RND transporter permease subunit [Acidobacteriota bacterium]
MNSALAKFVEGHARGLVTVCLAFALAGAAFVFQTPVSMFPETNFPRIVILIDNGIQPVDVQMTTVTRPVEQAIRLVPGITNVRSITTRGGSQVDVFFRWDIDILDALHLTQGRLAQILPELPANTRFYVARMTFSVFPIIGFSITSSTRTLTDLYDLAYYQLSPRLYRLPGVAETTITGGRSREFHIVVDPEKLNSYNLPITAISDSIRSSNIITAAGIVQENYHLYLTTVSGLLRTKEQIEQTVIKVVNGNPVLVKDLASVVDGQAPAYNVVTANGRDAVLVNIRQQPDGNAVAIADAVNLELKEIRKTLPPGVEISTFYDESLLVRDSITSVRDSILLGLGLSMLVLLLFLKSWRTTLIAAIVIPVATLTAVVFLKLFHMSFNMMTLGGLAACIGVVIDDAIVMVENIVVHLSLGQSPSEASRNAITELTPALIGSTLTPIVVFVPLIFLGGITAVFFRALALTLVTALMASLFLAIFLTPVLARLFLKSSVRKSASLHEAEQASEGRFMQALTRAYEATLRLALRFRIVVVAAAVLILGGSVWMFNTLGSGFMPEIDEGAFVLDYIMPPGTALAETDRVLRHIETFLKETPEVESYSRRTGAELGLAVTETNTGDFLIRLKRDRTRSEEEIISELRDKVAESEPVIETEFPHIMEDLVADLVSSPEPVEIKIYHPDEATFRKVAEDIEAWLPKVQGVVDITNRTVVIGPAVNFRVDMQKAQRAGFGVNDIAAAEMAMVDGDLASTVIRDNRQIGIRVRYPTEYRASAEKLNSLLMTSPTGQTVPLSSIAELQVDQGQYEIHRDNLRDMTSVTARLEGRDLGTGVQEIKDRLFKEVNIPPGTEIEFGGVYQTQQESYQSLGQVFLASILLIFIILVFEFRSFTHPIAILIATLLCTFGALLALKLTGQTLNICSLMGGIMVIGIVHKNGILMLDSERFFSEEQGLPAQEAVFEAGRRRLRPILMTALATISGMLPLALGVGAGAQMLRPLAIAVIGGVTASMVLSLLITPVLFLILKQKSLKPVAA